MQARSDKWRTIVASKNFWLNVEAVINNVTYTEITAPVIERSIFSNELGIGNCVAASCKFSVRADSASIPKSAKVVIRAQVCREDPTDPTTIEESEKIPVGTFFIYTREYNKDIAKGNTAENENENIGLVTLQCYDAMLKANQLYITNPTSDPQSRIGWAGGKSMADCVTEIAARLGVSVDSRTRINSGSNYKIQYPAHYVHSTDADTETGAETIPSEQSSNYTMADVLRLIAAFHGGNWVITPANELRLIPLERPPYSSTSKDGSTASGTPIKMAVNVPIVLGKVTAGNQITVSRITVTRAEKEVFTQGNDTGFTLQASGSQYETVALHEAAKADLYTKYVSSNALTYNPFTVEKACMDPCAELGDQVYIKAQSENNARVLSVICAQSMTFGTDFRVNLSAPAKVENESEYPFQTQTQKLKSDLQKLQATSESFIEQTNNRISLEVLQRKCADTALSGRIDVTAEQIALEVTDRTNADTELSGRIQVNADNISLKVNKGEVSSEISVESDEVRITGNRLVVQSTNFYLDRQGNVDITGDFTTTDSYSKLTMQSGGFNLYNQNTLVGRIRGDSQASSSASSSTSTNIMKLEADGGGIIFSNGSTYQFAYNLGINPNGYTETFWFGQDVRVAGTIKVREVEFEGSAGTSSLTYTRTNENVSGVKAVGNLMATGDIWCNGTKHRAVKTDHYGTLGLNSMESTVCVFSDLGSGMLDETGICYVFFGPDFAETVDLSHAYQVFLTQTSDGAIAWTEKNKDHFIVHGRPGTAFDWIVYARQRDYVAHRLEQIEDISDDSPIFDDSIFDNDNRPADICEAYMNSFADNLEEQAMSYLENYEKEISDL